MKLSFSLNKPKQQPAPAPAPSIAPSAAFSSAEDDDHIDAAPTSVFADRHTAGNKKLLAHGVESSRDKKKRLQAEKMEAVYDYDGAWESIQAERQRQKEIKDSEARDRKPKYIHGLLSSAATRKLDHLRAEEKMIQLERAIEGDQFKDKEEFVTQAYRDQMAEVRKAEEEEKRRDELQKKSGFKSSGMTHFYRKMLEESEQNHEATVAATQKRIIGPQGPSPNLTIVKPPDFASLSDLDLAKLARAQGKEVELNDDNQIVDKRELLAAGLNLSAPNTRRLGAPSGTGHDSAATKDAVQTHRAAGVAATRKEINERRAREIQQQLADEEDRVLQEKRKAEEDAIARTVTKRNTESDISSARERYLQRKRQKLAQSEELGQDP